MLHFPYRVIHRSSDCNETFTHCCKHCCGGFGNLKNLKIIPAGVPGVVIHSDLHEILHILPSKQEESHCLHDHSLFIVLTGVPGVALHSDLDEILHKC